jgi:hypothetical protein
VSGSGSRIVPRDVRPGDVDRGFLPGQRNERQNAELPSGQIAQGRPPFPALDLSEVSTGDGVEKSLNDGLTLKAPYPLLVVADGFCEPAHIALGQILFQQWQQVDL